jgi:hypothetical protein
MYKKDKEQIKKDEKRGNNCEINVQRICYVARLSG